ncbi:MAG: ABC transporter substrate-binding protein [Candidatus Nealsonbacteria bacterium]|nr:ABC transporter substrate-binding protein [Candidatus Nealsonbacteria bacterium]
MKRVWSAVAVFLAAVLVLTGCAGRVATAPKQEFTVAWSIYVGWMPWPYADESGILQKWADKENIKINLVQFDYVPSIEAYVAGKVDAVVMTNMEALNMAAAAGVDTTGIIVGDYSNGNDAVLTRNNLGLRELRGKEVYIVEGSVSQYLLGRAFDITGGITENDVRLMNTSDADIGPAFITNKKQEVVVTWNPIVLEVESQVPGVKNIFNSSLIPYEILDIMFVRTEVLNKHPELARALAGAWYETLGLMQARTPEGTTALNAMAEKSGTTLASYNKQLETTYMFWKPTDAAALTRGKKLVEVMDLVRKFSFDHGLFGQGHVSVDSVGVTFPDGTVLGDQNNVKLRFTDKYMK